MLRFFFYKHLPDNTASLKTLYSSKHYPELSVTFSHFEISKYNGSKQDDKTF